MPSFLIGSLSPRESALVGSAIVAFVQQWIGWGISAPLQTDKTYDFFGSAGFIVLAIGTFTYGRYYHARQIIVTLAVLLWALRLGGFLVMRVIKTGGDSRFDDAKHKPGKYLVFWTLQAVWVWTVSLPLTVLNTTQHNPDLWASDVIGGIIWIVGFACESAADIQKFVWKNNPANKGKFITSGLWRWSRHPNYFGEIAMWWGIWLMTICVLDKGYWLTVVSPLFTMALLLFVSGIPIQEKQAQKRWGADPAYQRYKRQSRLLVPLPRLCPKDPPGDQEKTEAGDRADFRDQD